MLIGIGKTTKRIPGLPNVVGMNKYEAKALLESLGWTFYLLYPSHPDGLWIGNGPFSNISLGVDTVAGVHGWSPYVPILPGTANTGQEIFFYCYTVPAGQTE